jgi:hypothetical protein
VGLKLLYENPFRQWLSTLGAAEVNPLIDAAVTRAETAAKDLHGQKDADRRQIISAKAKELGRLDDGEKLHGFYFRLSRETAAEMRVQRGYESDGERAREQAGFIEELLMDVLAQAFDRYLRDNAFDFLVQLRADDKMPKEPRCKLLRPVLDGNAAAAQEWQLLLYFLLHLVPVDDAGRLLHQIRKWDIVAGKAAGTSGSGDADVARVVRTLTLYLDMHDAKFTGPQAIDALRGFQELYERQATFDRIFKVEGFDDDMLLPRRGLREIMRFGHLPPLRSIFHAHKVADATVDGVLEAEKGPVAAAQRRREKLHETWARQRKSFDASDLERYLEALAKVMEHRLGAAHVRLFNHVKLHRLMMAVLGRLVDFAGLYERDLYFAMLALIHPGASPQAVLDKDGRRFLSRGQIIEARRKLRDQTIEHEVARLFGPPYGGVVNMRNDVAHFNMLNPNRSRGPRIDLTAQVNAARLMMAYDRKLKNAVAQSVIELVEREGLHLSWSVKAEGGEHVLAHAEVRGKQAKHLSGLELFEHEKNGEKRRTHHILESLHGRHLVEMVASLFNGAAVHGSQDVAALPMSRIDWGWTVARMHEEKKGGSNPTRPARR